MSDAARGLAVWAFIELPVLIVVGGVIQLLSGNGFDAGSAWHVLAWLLTAIGVLGVAALLGLPSLLRDEMSAADLAVPVLATGLLATSAALAAEGLYSWGSWGSGIAIGVVLAIAGVASVRRAEGRALRDADEAELEKRDHERRLGAPGDVHRIL